MVVLLGLSGFFSGSETALFSLDAVTLSRMKSGGGMGRLAARLCSMPQRLLVSILFGNMLVNISFYVLSASIVNEAARTRSAVAAGGYGLAMLACVIVFGEVLPKAVAVSYPAAAARVVALPVYVFQNLVGRWIARVLSPLLRREKPLKRARATREELQYLITLSRREKNIDRKSSEMVLDIVALSALRAKDVMVPRTDVVRVSGRTTLAEAASAAAPAGIHRIVVLDENEQNVIGTVHTPEILKAIHRGRSGDPVASLSRKMHYFPEGGRASELLEHFHSHPKEYMVAIVDEYGDFAGIASIEDLIEVFVGEVRDEFESTAVDPQPLPDGGYRVPGGFPVREWADLMEIGDDLPDGTEELPYSTIAGLIIHHLERMPRKGDTVRTAGIEFVVTRVEKHRIVEVEVRAEGGEDGDDNNG